MRGDETISGNEDQVNSMEKRLVPVGQAVKEEDKILSFLQVYWRSLG